MYIYVTCRPDIGYAITTIFNFSRKPPVLHYSYLESIAKCLLNVLILPRTGIYIKHITTQLDLDNTVQ